MPLPLVWSHTKTVRACNAPEIPQAEWEKHRELLKELYITNNKTLPEVKDYMATHFDFAPSTRQYTRQFEHWQYFKNSSRHRQQHANSNGPTSRGPSVQTSSVPHRMPNEYRNDNLEEEFDDVRRAWIHTSQAQLATHTSSAKRNVSKPCFTNTECLPLQCLSVGAPLAAVDQSCNELLRQEKERVVGDAMRPDELPKRLVQECHCEAQDASMSRLFSHIEEDQLTPALSRALSTADSNSVETDSLSSFGSVGNGVRVLMDVDDEATTQLPIIRNEDSIYGVGMPIASQTVSVYTAAAGIDAQLPVLSEEVWTYRPSQLLLNPTAAKSKLFTDDLDQIREVADFFYAAQSSEDAFNLYYIIFSQATGHLSLDVINLWYTVFSFAPGQICLDLATPLVLQGAIDLTKSATIPANYADIARLIPDVDPSKLEVSAATSAKICLLHSHLGNCYRALGRLGSAEHHCHIGLQTYRQLPEQFQYIGCRVTLLSNLELVLKDSRQPRALDLSLNDIFPIDLTGGDLYLYIESYSSTLTNDAFNDIIRDADEILWDQAPTQRDLVNFEMTVLFCCFWAQWRAERQTTSLRLVRLAQFEEKTGIPPTETLSTLASLILDPELSPFDGLGCSQFGEGVQTTRRDLDGLNGPLPGKKYTFGQRALVLCRNLPKLSATELFNAFLHAYASPLRRKGCRFSSQTYGSSVQAFVRGFVDSHFLLNLSERAAAEMRVSNGPGQPWLSPSSDPPMLPTPCSSRMSFSSFASFKATGRREKRIVSNSGNDAQLQRANDKRFSTGSSILKRRWSQLSSKLSLNSSIVSVKEDETEDIIMHDAF